MSKIIRIRHGWKEPDRFINRKIRSPELIVKGLIMGTFQVDGNPNHYCLQSTNGQEDIWYEIPIGFPLIKYYESCLEMKEWQGSREE